MIHFGSVTTDVVYARSLRQVLNAGVGCHNLFSATDDMSVYRKVMDTNYYGYLYCTKYAFPHLKANNGMLVVISSFSGMSSSVHISSVFLKNATSCVSRCWIECRLLWRLRYIHVYDDSATDVFVPASDVICLISLPVFFLYDLYR